MKSSIYFIVALFVVFIFSVNFVDAQVNPTQINQLVELNGIDNDGINWWISAYYNNCWKLYKVASDRSTILVSYDLPYTYQVEQIQGVAYREGYVYVRIHPSGLIYKVDPSNGSYTTSSYSTRIRTFDMAFMGSTLWQTRDDTISNNFEVYSSSGDEFILTGFCYC